MVKFYLKPEIEQIFKKYELEIYTPMQLNLIKSEFNSLFSKLGYDFNCIKYNIEFDESTRTLKVIPLNIYTLYAFHNLNSNKIFTFERNNQSYLNRELNIFFKFSKKKKYGRYTK